MDGSDQRGKEFVPSAGQVTARGIGDDDGELNSNPLAGVAHMAQQKMLQLRFLVLPEGLHAGFAGPPMPVQRPLQVYNGGKSRVGLAVQTKKF